MDLNLAGRTVLITGGSKGIGLGCAKRFASEGCNLVLAARSADQLETAADTIRKSAQVNVQTLALDLSQQAARDRLVASHPEIDVLVNNAGAIPGGDIFAVDDKAWREGWELKVFGYVNLTRAYFTLMKERKRGVIINICGAGGETMSFGYVAGAAGNASLMAFSRAMGGTSTDFGVRILAVNPGPVETDRVVYLAKQRASAAGDESKWRQSFARMPYGRPAMTDEIAPMVVFLASDLSRYISGTVVTIDGGLQYKIAEVAMPFAKTHDGVKLHYESAGNGPPIIFVHELAGTWHSFAPQIAALKARYRCIAYNARGYPPSDVPPSVESYSQDLAASDIGAVMDAAGARCGACDGRLDGLGRGAAIRAQSAGARPLGHSLQHRQRLRREARRIPRRDGGARPLRRGERHGGGGGKFRQLAEPAQAQGQEPGALCRFRRRDRGAVGARHHQHDARRAEPPPAALRAQGGDRGAQGCRRSSSSAPRTRPASSRAGSSRILCRARGSR